ncbi:hypothetical protein vseg_006573 [Gypsophila vaccaria]
MVTMAVQIVQPPKITTTFNPSSTHPFTKLPLKPSKVTTFTSNNSKPSSFPQFVNKNRSFCCRVSSSEVNDLEIAVDDNNKAKVTVQSTDKPRLVLKFIWMEKNIGLGLDQTVPGHGTIPLSPYYFWPRKDAWEELKLLLESKPWISQKQMIILLNQATDIINLWQQSGGNLAS